MPTHKLGSTVGSSPINGSVIIAVDPGTTRSAMVFLQGQTIVASALESNEWVRNLLEREHNSGDMLVVEEFESFGMPIGREVMQSIFWSGRFVEAWGGDWVLIPRRAVKLHHCKSARANDATIRQALLDRYGPGRTAAIGTKAHPGPLYGIKRDLWSALALGLTYYDNDGRRQQQRIADFWPVVRGEKTS